MNLELMKFIQEIFSWGEGFFDILFAVFTFFGEEIFLFIIIPIFFWAINRRFGEYLAFSGFISLAFNGIAKEIFSVARPIGNENVRYVEIEHFLVDTKILNGTYSFPSGHSQNVASLFTALSYWYKKKSLIILSVILILLVMISRVYLGVHWPFDVLVGALAGIAISIFCYYIFKRYYNYRKFIYVGLATVSLVGLFISVDPDVFKCIGAFVGFAIAVIFEDRFVKFKVDGRKWKRVLRVIIGITIIIGLKIGLKSLFEMIGDGIIFDFFRYFIIVFFGLAIYPWIFKKINL